MPSFEQDSIELMASIKSVKFNGIKEGDGLLVLNVPASDTAPLARLLCYREKPIKVTIEPQSEKT